MTALGVVLGLFVLGCVGYVVVTYAVLLAQRPTTKTTTMTRTAPLAAIARSALTELCVTLALMPFWPLWLVLGAAYPMVEEAGGEATRARRPIVLLHGFGMTRTSWLVLGHRLARRGLGPLYGTTYFSLQSVRRSAEQLAAFVERACAKAGAERVDIVAHSMGGVVARYYLERLGGATRVGRLITIASPHRGTVLGRYGVVRGARQLAAGSSLLAELATPASGVAYTSIWSRSDSMVIPPSSSSITPAGEDRVFDDLGHLSLLASRRVVDVIVERLTVGLTV
jgi:triacylglycerol esterase/lipase EstA (alpha/beta hydrolase family)